MKNLIFLLITISICLSLSAFSQQRLEVEGKINLLNDNEADAPINGDIRYNASANNGAGDFEGFLNGVWCSLTTKIEYGCPDEFEGESIFINGLPVYTEYTDENGNSLLPADVVFTEECDCEDGDDEDGDGLIDCLDPDCAQEECCNVECNCTDGIDNDGDGNIDCLDQDCAQEECCFVECDCTDGIDNNGNGLVDCEDIDCCAEPGNNCPIPSSETACNCIDQMDNDGDGLSDCEDPDCAPWCQN